LEIWEIRAIFSQESFVCVKIIFAGFKKLQNFAQKNTVCDHSLIFNPKKIKMKNPEFFGIFFNILNSEFWIQLYIIWKHRPLPKG